MPLLLPFVFLPLIEIALFIAVGSQIGVAATLALIVLSGLLGLTLLRGQSERSRAMMRGTLRIDPGTAVAEGVFRIASGLLLLLPGFLTDVIGLVLMIPPLQRAIVRAVGARAVVTTRVWRGGEVVEGEYSVREPARDPLDPSHRLDRRP